MTNLLPCPFCGGEASKRLFYKGKYRVHCNVCDAHSGDVCDTEAEAIAAWNTRADYHGYEQAAIEAWENIKAWNTRAERTCHILIDKVGLAYCDKCEESAGSGASPRWVFSEHTKYCPNCGSKVVE